MATLTEPGYEAYTSSLIKAQQPLARMASVREVAYAVLFLASDESNAVTGSALYVDGAAGAATSGPYIIANATALSSESSWPSAHAASVRLRSLGAATVPSSRSAPWLRPKSSRRGIHPLCAVWRCADDAGQHVQDPQLENSTLAALQPLA